MAYAGFPGQERKALCSMPLLEVYPVVRETLRAVAPTSIFGV